MDDDGLDVILVGYSPRIRGGVTRVTNTVMERLRNVHLHPSLICYYPRHRAVYHYLVSLLLFPKKILRFRKAVVHLIIASKGDVIRGLPFIWCTKLLGRPLCVQYHVNTAVPFIRRSSRMLTLMVQRTLGIVDVHCFLSRRLLEGFKGQMESCGDFQVIPNALGERWYAEPLPLEMRHRDVVFFGRWSRDKGVEDLVACMEKTKPGISCEIYTNEVPKESYRGCKISSWVDETEVLEVMRTSKLLVLPSHSEAFPMVLLEAAACGTPFVASSVGGVPDIVEQSGAGILFEAGDREAMRAGVERLMHDAKEWQRLSLNGRLWAQGVRQSAVCSQWAQLYSDLASRGRHRRL